MLGLHEIRDNANQKRTLSLSLSLSLSLGVVEARLRKLARYADLAEELRGLKHPWTVHNLALEVGARGFVARSTFNFLRKIGFTPQAAKTTCRQVSEVVARCSYAIYLRHSEKRWNSSRTLLVPNSCMEPSMEIDPGLRGEETLCMAS